MAAQETDTKDYYFDSYASHNIHAEMIQDSVRTDSYRDAIMMNKHLFKDKVVLDVGCGTGILSMFCAQAGARHVYGVDMSNIIHKAREIVKVNSLSGKVTLLQGKMEEVELPVDKVDIIVSEWMGYFLVYESMLDTVLYARDKYLVEGGLILPDRATMHLAAIEDGQYKTEKFDFWDSVYGFDMSVMKADVLREPLVDCVEEKAVVTKSCMIKSIDILTVKKEDLAFKSSFVLEAGKDDLVHGLVAWFDIYFEQGLMKPVYFSTGPDSHYTHWKQTVFYLKGDVAVKQGEQFTGTLTCRPNSENHRDLDIEIDIEFDGQFGQLKESVSYLMR